MVRTIVTSVRVFAGETHDRVRIWSRGGLAGELVVTHGDGPDLARRLLPDAPDVAEAFDGISTFVREVVIT
jgi:hypothetical protein